MKDRLTREKERLAQVWQSLAPEQQAMRKQSERLNALTKELEAFRSEIVSLEEACKLAGYYTDGSAAGARAMFENAMAREGVLVETCKVENMIKESLDITERLLEREKKALRKVSDVSLQIMYALTDVFPGARAGAHGEILESCRWLSATERSLITC
jgi:hypothetical protein